MAIEDEAAVAAPATEVVQPEAVKDDVAKAESDKAPDPEAVKEEPDKDEKPKPKRADRFREMQDRATAAEQRALFEARRADRLQKEIAALQTDATGDDFDKAQTAKVKLAVKESQLDELADNYQAARADRSSATAAMFEARVVEASERIPDIVSVFNSPEFNRTPISAHAVDVIARSEHGPDLMYYLVKNPGDAQRIAALPAALQGVELTKLEHKIISKPNVKKHSTAPAPPSTVGGSKAPAAKDPNSMSMEEYSAWYKNRARA
jgi:hypothetical protein